MSYSRFLFCVLLKNKLNAKISKGDTMLYDFIIIDKTSAAPLYMQIYASIRRSVENGSLVKNTKLPSVRQLSSGLEVSKDMTTISAAKALTIKSLILTNGKSMSKR